MTSWRLSAASSGARRAGSALLPVPATDAQAFQGRGVIYGGPRTPIPGPAPVPGIDREKTALAQGGWIGLPSSAFTAWAPSVMWTVRRTRGEGRLQVFHELRITNHESLRQLLAHPIH